jgi:hypothetical protein
MNYDELMKKARETNRQRDKMDGFNYASLPPSVVIDTAKMAIKAGIVTDDWNAVAEGLAMLEDMQSRFIVVRGETK